MERRSDEEGTFRVLPSGARPCLWMLAGLLSYRLCDREYDCERCPLDAAIRGAPRAPDAGIAVTPPAWGIRDGLSYHPVYGWIVPGAGRRVRWGVDGWTAQLLERVTAVILPAVGTRLLRGKVACWATVEGSLVPLRSPLSGEVARTNRALQADPMLMTHSPYDAGWLLDVEADDGSAATRRWIGARERRERAAKQTRRMHRSALGYLHAGQEIGPTAPDGGVVLSDLRRMLGPSRYHRLVVSVLR